MNRWFRFAIVTAALLWLIRWEYHFCGPRMRYRVNRYTGEGQIGWDVFQGTTSQNWQPARMDAESLAALHGGAGVVMPFDALETVVTLACLMIFFKGVHIWQRTHSGYRHCIKCAGFIKQPALFCNTCGWNQRAPYPPPPQPVVIPRAQPTPRLARTRRPRERWIAAVLALLLGGAGVHRFYLGQLGWGLTYALFIWTGIPSLLSWCELIWLVCMTDEAFDERFNP